MHHQRAETAILPKAQLSNSWNYDDAKSKHSTDPRQIVARSLTDK